MAAALSSEDFNNLQLLLKAPSKDVVREVCVESHRCPSRRLTETTAEKLNITTAQAAQLVQSLRVLCQSVLFRHCVSVEDVLCVFPSSFHCSLKNLLTRTLLENSPTWRAEALSEHISLPRLQEVDWRVAMVTGSDAVGRMSVCTCMVQLQMEDRCPGGGGGAVSTVTVELSRESVETMLDGLRRIREQLTGVTGK